MKLGVVYVCPVVNWPQYEGPARRFVSAYTMFPAEYPHQLHVVCNGGNPNPEILSLFSETSPIYHQHDNSGWDIGAFEKVTAVDCDLILFLGANTHFKRAGWLRRLIEAHERFGDGLYGTSASFAIYPHIRTNGFMCHPKLVHAAWINNRFRSKTRHAFEVRKTSLTTMAKQQGIPCLLVTWDGFYQQDEWRKAPNIFQRGDQSNCLIFDRHHEIYESSTPRQKIRLERITDGNKFEFYRSAIQGRIERWLKLKRLEISGK
jgi:hypothetical protein